jgi:hypothetical protein
MPTQMISSETPTVKPVTTTTNAATAMGRLTMRKTMSRRSCDQLARGPGVV